MKVYITAIILLMIPHAPTHALDIGYISSFINSDSHILEKEITNNSDNEHQVNIQIERISSPLKEGKVIPMDKPGELLLTPEKLTLPANTRQSVHFTYKGQKDDKERYYRIIWLDQELYSTQKNHPAHHSMIKSSTKVGTLIVVSPRKIKYDYQYNNGNIVNTGNATFKVIAYGPCLKSISKTDCRENYFLIPGRSRELSRVDISDKNSYITLWKSGQFISVK